MSTIDAASAHKKNVLRIAVATVLILSVPLITMQFSEDVDWNLADFIVIGLLLFGTGIVYEFVVKKLQTKTQQMIAAAILLAVLLLIWAELAVGVFGSPFAGS
jgi:hypothetical protein